MTTHASARDARREAQLVAGDGFDARVLEPSPPPVVDEAFFADDPVSVDDASPGRRVISPAGNGDLTWQEWLQDRSGRSDWASERWLGAYRRLVTPPTPFAQTRTALHRVAVYVVAPARRRVNTKIGLRFTFGGFGTPFFAGADGAEQVRVVGAELVRQVGEAAVVEPMTTLAGAAALALDGPPDVAWAEGFDVPAAGDVDAELTIDPASAGALGDWFGFAWSVLEELRADTASIEPGRVQLWPEHFDAAFDCVAGGNLRSATFGASPGDAGIDEPYLYVLPAEFDTLQPNDLWNATGFKGAVLALREFVDSPDQRESALAFLRQCRAALDVA